MSVKWLLAGAGDISRKRVGPALKEAAGGELYGVCDIDINVAKRLAATLGLDNIYDNYSGSLKNEDIDAVYIATPVFLHSKMAIEALEAGKHVLVEKPMAINSKEAEHMNSIAEKTGKKLGVSYFRRCFDKYQYAKNMIDNDEFGEIVLVRMTYFSWYNPAKDDPKYWRVIKEKSGGGVLSDMGTHMFDVLIGLLGMPYSVYAKTETLVQKYDVEDSASMIMKMPWGAQIVGTFHWCSKTWSHEFEIIGTEAKIKWHPFDAPTFIKTVGRDTKELNLAPADNVHLPLIEEFNESILNNKMFTSSGKESIKTNILVDAIYRSSNEKREIKL